MAQPRQGCEIGVDTPSGLVHPPEEAVKVVGDPNARIVDVKLTDGVAVGQNGEGDERADGQDEDRNGSHETRAMTTPHIAFPPRRVYALNCSSSPAAT